MTAKTSQTLRKTGAAAVGSVWWYFLLRGLLLIGVGIFLLIKPGLSTVALLQVIGVLVLVDGLITAATGIAGEAESRFWAIVRGVLLVAAGVFVFLQPAMLAKVAVTTVLYIIAPLVVISGLLEIKSSLSSRGEETEGSVLSGILTLVLGVLLFITPLFFGIMIIRVLGIVAILIGIVLLFLAFKFRRLRNRIAG